MSEAMLAAAKLYNNPRYFDPSEVRIRKNRARRSRIVRRQRMLLGFIAAVILFALIFAASSFMSDAQSDSFTPEYKYYKAVTVHTGDSLWSIAQEHYNDGRYDNINEYIAEITSINSISDSSTLKAGESLIIPYYSTEYR